MNIRLYSLIVCSFLLCFLSNVSIAGESGKYQEATQEEMMGGEFALMFGAQTGPFDVGTGWFLSGELGIPLMNMESGKIMGLISIGVGKNEDDISTEPTVNLIEPGLLPEQTEVDLTTVSIILGLKYKLLMHDLVQPYILAGPGINIFLNDTDPGDNVGGIAPQPAELSDRGFPSGQGNVELGLHAGVGVDFNITEKIFLGGEARFNWVDRENGSWGTYGVRTGFRF